MRWFTPEWANGSLEDRTASKILRDESEHRARLSAESSGPIHEMAAYAPNLDLKDAWITTVETNRARSMVAIEVIQGNLQSGYGVLRLDFGDAELFEPTSGELDEMLIDPRCEIRYWEIDRSRVGDLFELRCLLWPSGELGVRFLSVSYGWAPLAARSEKPASRVIEGSSLT